MSLIKQQSKKLKFYKTMKNVTYVLTWLACYGTMIIFTMWISNLTMSLAIIGPAMGAYAIVQGFIAVLATTTLNNVWRETIREQEELVELYEERHERLGGKFDD